MEVQLTASLIGYAPSEPATVSVEGSGRFVEVEIRLAREAIELEGLTVTARGFELRHRATIEGFYERQRDAPRVGSRRLYLGDDPMVRSAADIPTLLRNAFLGSRGCLITYIDGRPVRDGLREPLYGVVGFEFYRFHYEAPLEMRAKAGICTATMGGYSVMALWTDRSGAVVDPSRLQLRVQDEATGQSLDATIFEVRDGGVAAEIASVESGLGWVDLPEGRGVTLVARSEGYFDSAPIVITPEDRRQGVALVWMRPMNSGARIDTPGVRRDERGGAQARVRPRENGGGGIRTHESRRTPVFKTGALSRSATPPGARCGPG